MGNSEEGKLHEPENPTSPPMELQDQKGVHVYPNWAMMQAYYGPRFAVPPYLNSAAGSSHAPPPYMWVPPQSMMPPYGVPYPAFYAHGGVYGHPGVPTAGTAFGTDISVQSSGQTDGGSNKKLKEVAISIGNGNAVSGERGADHRLLESEETDDSSDGSNGVTAEAGEGGMKRSRPGSPNSFLSEEDVKAKKKGNSKPATRNEAWLLNERDLKRERRKQSNRESARRSRLRKQAEAEQLTSKVQTIITENTSLKSKITEFIELSKKLKLENVKLMERLKDAQSEGLNSKKMKDCTANLIERVNESDHKSRGNKLHQLLDAIASPRTDAVAAS